jgi:hypothetical protein
MALRGGSGGGGGGGGSGGGGGGGGEGGSNSGTLAGEPFARGAELFVQAPVEWGVGVGGGTGTVFRHGLPAAVTAVGWCGLTPR